MSHSSNDWQADPLEWGRGERLIEMFLEPTCPYSARAFGKLGDLVDQAGPENIRVRVWLHSQPWHMFSGIICRTIIAASTGPGGRSDARKLMAAVYAHRNDFEFEDHRTGPNLAVSPEELVRNMEALTGLDLASPFQHSGLDSEVKRHTRYARQNGIHVSPTFMVDGLINPNLSSGDNVEQWLEQLA